MNPAPTSNLILPQDSLIALGDGAVAFRVTEFGGHPVPEGGLALEIPAGGVLTVWPDGQYVFEGTLSDDGAHVNTYYSFVVDFFGGTTTLGTFALGEQAPEEDLPDFQSWSLEDILALEDAVGLVVDLPGPVAELSDGSVAGHVFSDPGLDPGGDFAIDVLDHAIKASYES